VSCNSKKGIKVGEVLKLLRLVLKSGSMFRTL
jgi:hypothetical protein